MNESEKDEFSLVDDGISVQYFNQSSLQQNDLQIGSTAVLKGNRHI